MNQTILSTPPVQVRHVRHADLQEDTEAYPDVMEPARRRSISHVLGQHPKAALRGAHKFHLDYLVSGAATEPPLHSHDYSEIFMVLQGGYRFFWGNHAEHYVDLGPLDMFSVPPKVMRKFHSNREQPGMLLAIFDTTLRDPDDGIVISQALIDEEGGAEKYAKYGSGWGDSVDEDRIQSYIARISDLASKAPDEGGIVPLIATDQADAGISTPHHVTAQFVFVNSALDVEPTSASEVFVPVRGTCQLTVDGEVFDLQSFDALSVDGGGTRSLRAAEGEQVVLLRIIDTRSETGPATVI